MQSRLVSGAVWGGFWGSEIQKFSHKSLLVQQATLTVLFSPPLFCKGCASWEHFACSALLDAWGHRDVPALVCSAPIPEGRGMEERPLAQRNHPAIRTRWVCTGWEPPLGNTNCTRSFPSAAKLTERICALLNPLFRRNLGSPAASCHRYLLSQLIRVFGELIKFPVRAGAVSCAR